MTRDVVHTWRHAVTFGRAWSEADENLARELLLEWAEARYLTPALSEREVRMLSLVGRPVPIEVERDDYNAFAGYAMGFVSTDPATWTHTRDNFPEPTHETRLKQRGVGGKCVLRGIEEPYTAP